MRFIVMVNDALKGDPMAMRQFSRHIRRPQPASGNGSSNASSSQTGSAPSSGSDSTSTEAASGQHGSTGMQLAAAWIGLMMFSLLLPACTTPSTQRFAFAVRDCETALPVVGAHATITLHRQPFWFDGHPVRLTTDNVGMDHAFLVLNQTAYKVNITREGYRDVCFDLPVLNNRFPYGHWLSSINCQHTSSEPCTDGCLVSRLELMVTEPMPE